ncbi:MAG: sulfurtransferase [Deltaproteobacteria bacterium SG8_13]|nr:MAG: sulfurtransferase [Deltaproteobacteria bacterium SG8_13]
MRWKQFFTPVKSFSFQEAKDFMVKTPGDAFTLLDVRQPAEYESEHLPGAKLIPLADLGQRLGEIDAGKPAVVYCAIGGRSRIAAQMLAAKGFKEVINLSGGIKAWRSEKAIGDQELGLDLFSGKESPEETLVVAYSLEEGLRDFYVSMASKVKDEKARRLFETLSTIEIKHQDRIFNEYQKVSGSSVSREEFANRIVNPAMEGGLTTDEYLKLYQPDLDVPAEVISLAMAIEAQALDLYQRAAERAGTEASKTALLQIANEERSHLEQLGKLFENL